MKLTVVLNLVGFVAAAAAGAPEALTVVQSHMDSYLLNTLDTEPER